MFSLWVVLSSLRLLEIPVKICLLDWHKYYIVLKHFYITEAGIALLILVTYRNKIYGVIINMKININIGLLILVSMLNVGVRENLLVGNEAATSLSD